MRLPAAYAWLLTVQDPPRMVAEALQLYGVQEGPGDTDNPVIMAWAREVGLDPSYRHDAVAWCGLFMALVAKRAGKAAPSEPLWALNWLNFGRPVSNDQAALGDVLVFERRDSRQRVVGGHVGLYVGEDSAALHVLGGNTADAVTVGRVLRARLRGVRRPLYQNQPKSVRRHILGVTGALSTNEA